LPGIIFPFWCYANDLNGGIDQLNSQGNAAISPPPDGYKDDGRSTLLHDFEINGSLSRQNVPVIVGRDKRKLVLFSHLFREIIEVTLRREGYEVVAVPDGVEALRYLLTEGTRLPDLILLDLVMPRLDGFAFALKIKQRPQFKAIPLVVISRRVGLLDWLKARLAGMRGYLPKPFKQHDLLALVATFVGPARDERSTIMHSQSSPGMSS
jgi:twitching motility two-component system response regulator PilG